jgi:hypothetical protein
MLKRLALELVVVGLLCTALAARPAVNLSIVDGRVWLVADRATVAQILAEWARVGHTEILNAEQVGKTPLTLDLRGVPELDALAIIMRSAGGFLTVNRAVEFDDPTVNVSQFTRVVIVASADQSKAGEPRPALPAPAPRPVHIEEPVVPPGSGQRVIGPDGQPMPDDQEDAPPPQTPAMLPPGRSIPPGFSPPPDAGSPAATPARPGIITAPAPRPRRSGE